MPAYKDKNGTWYAMVRYTDWRGEKKQKCQRGFETRRDALAWEAQFKLQKRADIDMTLESFYELYKEDIKPRLKENTWITKESIIEGKILPYLGKRKLSEITAKDIVDWQNAVMQLPGTGGKPLSPTFMKSIHAQLSAMFNHAIRYYQLPVNPARVAGSIGKEEFKEMKFWTKEEYLKFAEVMMDKPIYYYAFEVLYWTGIREGELLALTPEDFDFERKTLRINKSYQRLRGKDVITTPKTDAGVRMIAIPDFLCEEMKDCLKLYYDIQSSDRIFPMTKYGLCRNMESGSKAAGVKRIRIHDLRHSHVSLLINQGFSAFEIGKRVGHSSEKVTYRYAHLFPNKQTDMAEFLENQRMTEPDKGQNNAMSHDNCTSDEEGGKKNVS